MFLGEEMDETQESVRLAKVLLAALIIVLLVLLGIGYASAAPFIISDPTTQVVTGCGVQIDTAAKYDTPLLNSACHVDISSVATGTHTIKMTFFNTDPVWGRSETAFSLPLSFTKPVSVLPTAPANLVVTPN